MSTTTTLTQRQRAPRRLTESVSMKIGAEMEAAVRALLPSIPRPRVIVPQVTGPGIVARASGM